MSVIKNPTLYAGMLVWSLPFGNVLHAQMLPIDEHAAKLRNLSQEEKGDYLRSNRYSLYSSDYDRSLELMREGQTINRYSRKICWHWMEEYPFAHQFIKRTGGYRLASRPQGNTHYVQDSGCAVPDQGVDGIS